MKLNIGAGKHTFDDYFCIDAAQHPKASRRLDLLHEFAFDGDKLVNPLPLENNSAELILNTHFIEHFYRWEATALVAEFHRLLRPGGLLIIECPDIAKCALNLLKFTQDQYSMWGFYGDPSWEDPLMCHKWGYTPDSLSMLLAGQGFKNMKVKKPETHGRRANRDMRIECYK